VALLQALPAAGEAEAEAEAAALLLSTELPEPGAVTEELGAAAVLALLLALGEQSWEAFTLPGLQQRPGAQGPEQAELFRPAVLP
jgi:hypothetical protein